MPAELKQRRGPTDYAKWDKIDYKALGADDEEEAAAAERARMREEGAVSGQTDPARAYVEHAAEVEAAKKRLKELEEEQKQAELKLIQLDKEKKMMDRMFAIGAVALAILMGLTFWWTNTSSASARRF
uniref:Uncharacterized protein n=1 Tax=Neobodo designis TaxID=312471 RepID=A0A7S1L1W3_NEODS|mmetsp:Transcript_13024/g.40448  ORF Transcript_13024/g.40448 Transcript_13024/m.40448 type:complete len:128 (+) Transcript_13024:39-422(+)